MGLCMMLAVGFCRSWILGRWMRGLGGCGLRRLMCEGIIFVLLINLVGIYPKYEGLLPDITGFPYRLLLWHVN
ncbi:hypothetical protein BJX76DRAFT_198878 [Aspergillus varians]